MGASSLALGELTGVVFANGVPTAFTGIMRPAEHVAAASETKDEAGAASRSTRVYQGFASAGSPFKAEATKAQPNRSRAETSHLKLESPIHGAIRPLMLSPIPLPASPAASQPTSRPAPAQTPAAARNPILSRNPTFGVGIEGPTNSNGAALEIMRGGASASPAPASMAPNSYVGRGEAPASTGVESTSPHAAFSLPARGHEQLVIPASTLTGPAPTSVPYSITWSNPSGGGGAATGYLSIVQSGFGYVGGSAQFVVSAVATSGGTPTLSNISWSYSGTTPLYVPTPVPNPTAGDKQFTRTTYNLAAQSGASVSFAWGEFPSAGSMTVSATVTVSGHTGTASASIPAVVQKPQLTGDLTWETATSTTKWPNWLSDGVATTGPTSGMDWTFSSSSGGNIVIVQIMTSGEIVVASPTQTLYAYSKHKDSAGNVQPTLFPLVDQAAGATDPFYGPPDNPLIDGDSPGVRLNAIPNQNFARLQADFTAYVMYNPGSGVYVPQAKFEWRVDATASKGAGGTWTSTDIITPGLTPGSFVENRTDWPYWEGLTGDNVTLV